MAKKITSCDVRMYTMGTGDCFVLSFKSDDDQKPRFQLMIDCGVKNISGQNMEPFTRDIIDHTEGEVDALLITHEHQDHVLGFQRNEEIFTNEFKVKELWLPWTENESDQLVKEWKKDYGKKKKSLATASEMLSNSIKEPLYAEIYGVGPLGERALSARKGISDALIELSNLNTDPIGAAGEYIGGLKGMKIVKEKLQKERVRFLETGSVIEDIEGLDNIRMYVLGPPKMWTDVKKEEGKEGETYKHNKELELVRGFSSLPFDEDESESSPFINDHIFDFELQGKIAKKEKKMVKEYQNPENNYRRIDYDWLMSAANLSLRLTQGINNLSSVLAIEFIDSGKVMLFPGDAEFGSWKSWHEIEWDEKGKDGTTHLTTDLLNRTVFYKVAHHMSHNGTAKEKGIDLMTDTSLVAMATLDYEVIHKTWKNTMPNRGLVRDLLNKTKGRLIILNPKGLHFDKAKTIKLEDEIIHRFDNLSRAKQKEFNDNFERKEHFVEFVVDGK